MAAASTFGGPASLRERADRPGGAAPVVAVAASPPHPGNAVMLLTRQGGTPTQVTRALPDSAPPGRAEQWFRAPLPSMQEGHSLDYRVELVRGGRRLASLPADGSWLTVTGDPSPPSAPTRPAPSPLDAPAPGDPRFAFELRFFAAITVGGRLEVVGETPEGYRVNFLVEQGTVCGPAIDGVIHPGGGDWMCVRPDGVGALDIRATCETADGAVIFYRGEGVLDLGPDGYAQIATGQLHGCSAFCATPSFVTADPRWNWLNRVQGFGIGRVVMEGPRVEYDIYLPQIANPLPGG